MASIIQKSAIPESKAFVARDLIAPHFDLNWHFHSEYQLFVVLEGRGTRFVGDSIKPFKEGDMVFTGPNLPHLWRSDPVYFDKKDQINTRGLVIYFQENFLGDSIGQKEELEKVYHFLQRSKRGLEIKGKTNQYVTQLMLELISLKGVPSIIQLLKILDTLANSTECHPIAHAEYINLYKETETARMSKVYEYVMKNFKRKISLEEVSALTYMTPSSFSRYFKSRANKAFSDFLSEIRIDHACKLLHEEDTNISEICYACGFATLSNFNKQFKEITGKTPLRYKKEYLQAIIS
jgi:AraC-like DNA-binding protein